MTVLSTILNTGYIGSQGLQGIQGQYGIVGATVTQGLQGLQGKSGTQGKTGTDASSAYDAGIVLEFGGTVTLAENPGAGFFKKNQFITTLYISYTDAHYNSSYQSELLSWGNNLGYLVLYDRNDFSVIEIDSVSDNGSFCSVAYSLQSTSLSLTLGNNSSFFFFPIGSTGVQGIQGLQGNQGIQGIQGKGSGSQGIQGIQGVQQGGNQGIQGRQGTTGLLSSGQGIQGIQGLQGRIFNTLSINSQSVNYTLVLTDAGKFILHPTADTNARAYTIPANSSVVFPVGTIITFINQRGAGIITIYCNDTMYLAEVGTTGTRQLAANGIASIFKVTTTEWIISGIGLT